MKWLSGKQLSTYREGTWRRANHMETTPPNSATGTASVEILRQGKHPMDTLSLRALFIRINKSP